MALKYHINGTEEFGYITINRFLYSFYMYMNTVKRITNLYRNASVQDLNGYVAHFCYLRLISFDTFIKVVWEHKDYVSANCLLRMLGDSVAVFRLIYMEPDKDLLILRHCLYVIDGCEQNLQMLPDDNFQEGYLNDEESVNFDKTVRLNRESRNRILKQAQEMLLVSPLKHKDDAAFRSIVARKNWKFKEFKDKKNDGNQYKWRELYELIGGGDDFDVLSYISQYTHGLSMSNLVIQMDEMNINAIVAVALGLIKRLHKYTLKFYPKEQAYILDGLLEPEMREKILACFDDAHRPEIAKWNKSINNKIEQLQNTGFYDIML